MEADIYQALEPTAGAEPGGLHAAHGARRGEEVHGEEPPQQGTALVLLNLAKRPGVVNVIGVVNDNLTNDPLFPYGGALLKCVISQEAIQTRSFSVCLSASTSLFWLYRIASSPFGSAAEETKRALP